MPNQQLFSSHRGRSAPPAESRNEAGGLAYAFGPRHALAQLAATGTFNQTFYGEPVNQLEGIRRAADLCSPEFVAKTAIYARERGHMKDMPTALCAMLSKADLGLLGRVFPRVIDNPRMLRGFVQMMRSGAFGRRSLGSGPKRLVREWLESRSDEQLFRGSIGNSPSLADVIKMVHPRPRTDARRALYGYLLGREHDAAALPRVVADYEAFKRGERAELPEVDFRLLTSLELTREHWAQIALRGRWHQTRMNLNTYARHGAFEVEGVSEALALRLASSEQIRAARAFPYQLFAAFLNVGSDVPALVRDALEQAMEVATENVPSLGTEAHVVVDVSGSMSSPITGHRKGASSKVRCVDVAALIAATLLRRNPGSSVLPVDTRVHAEHGLDPRAAIMQNAARLARFGGGGTDLGAALRHLNERRATGGLIVVVSDCESWVDARGASRWGRATGVMEAFREFQVRNPGARMVCIDLQPYGSTQAPDAPGEVMNVGGFSDAVFDQLANFVRGDMSPEHWVGEIEAISLA